MSDDNDIARFRGTTRLHLDISRVWLPDEREGRVELELETGRQLRVSLYSDGPVSDIMQELLARLNWPGAWLELGCEEDGRFSFRVMTPFPAGPEEPSPTANPMPDVKHPEVEIATSDTTIIGAIVQRQEENPRDRGWWRWSRPEWVPEHLVPPAHDEVRWAWGTRVDALVRAEAWDRCWERYEKPPAGLQG